MYILIGESSIVIIVSYMIVVWCSWKIYKFLKYQKNSIIFGNEFYEIQAQITRTLIAQALIPFFLVMIPYFFLLFNLFVPFHFFSPEVTSLSVLMFSYIPMANALSIIYFVTSYRKEAFKYIRKVWKKFLRELKRVC